MVREILVYVFLGLGSLLMLLAAIGLLRMPDLFLRMSATAKAGTLGAGLLLVGAALYFDDLTVTARSLATFVFLFLTAPVAAHMIGRASYFDGIPLWKGTVRDDLRGHYRLSTHRLETQPVPAGDNDMAEQSPEPADDL
jgi:multicomponent Na+:H+ antiporter subunit G